MKPNLVGPRANIEDDDGENEDAPLACLSILSHMSSLSALALWLALNSKPTSAVSDS